MLGDIVCYTLTPQDAEAINRRRMRSPGANGWPQGAQAHTGSPARAEDRLPAMITAEVQPAGTVNLKVCLDGNDDLWLQAVKSGIKAGQWCRRC